ncbi:MAG TPA: hypothetical protein VGG80_06495, partial [Acidobacteriaceae bacterium]
MSRIPPNPNEVEELENQLRRALRREAAPASLAPAVEARMNGTHVPGITPNTAPGIIPNTAPGGTPHTAPVPDAYEPHLWNPVVDEPVWRTWLTDLRGMFQREHLPPLVLTSQPVAVPDPFR